MPFTLQTGMKNKILRNHSSEITKFDSEIRKAEKTMRKIMKDNNGRGLAAPQVGLNKNLIVFLFNDKKIMTMCNPAIVSNSKEVKIFEEGCLSLPGVWGKVARYVDVVVKYQDMKGKQNQIELEDLNARVVQHEIDHLNGVLFLDKVEQGEFMCDKETDLEALDLQR